MQDILHRWFCSGCDFQSHGKLHDAVAGKERQQVGALALESFPGLFLQIEDLIIESGG